MRGSGQVATPLRTPYLDWWGLSTAPFQLEPDVRFTVEREGHREALARMLFGLSHLGGIVLVTGEIGCGKTMLAQALDRTLADDGFTIAAVANPPRTASGVLAAILGGLDRTPRGGGVAKLAARLRERLEDERAQGRRPIVVIDEAQRLDARALDEIRMLTNPGAGPGVPVVLLGQPELGPRVRSIPQVAQRVVVRYHLDGMGQDEVSRYIQHRCQVAGATRRLFTSRAEAEVHEETGGIPRLVNLLCANALFVGFVRKDTQVGEDLVRDLAEDRDAHSTGAG